MISATILTLIGSVDIYYFLKLLKKYVKLSKMLMVLNNQQKYLDVSQAIQLMQNNNISQQFPVIVKGFIKSVPSNPDKNILSLLTSAPIMKSHKLAQYIYKKIPYPQVLKNSFHMRPQSLQNVSFKIQDSKGSSISIENLERSNFSGALTEVVQKIHYYQKKSLSKFLTFLKQTFKGIFFFIPFKYNEEQIGQKIAYYGILNEQFSYVVGKLQKGKDNAYYIRNPKFVTKQILFIVSKLKRYKKILSIALILFTTIQIILLFYLAKYLKAKIGWKIKIFTGEDDEINEQISIEQTCIICFSAPRSVVLKPCKHYGLCYSCYKHISKQKVCPVCKENIEGIIRILIKK